MVSDYNSPASCDLGIYGHGVMHAAAVVFAHRGHAARRLVLYRAT